MNPYYANHPPLAADLFKQVSWTDEELDAIIGISRWLAKFFDKANDIIIAGYYWRRLEDFEQIKRSRNS